MGLSESVKQCDLNSAKDSIITALPPRKAVLFRTAYSMGKLGNSNTNDSIVNLCDSNKLGRNHMPLVIWNSEMEVHNKQNITKEQVQHYKRFLINGSSVECSSRKSINNVVEKQERRNTAKARKAKNPNSMINIRLDDHTLQPASTQSERIGRSQFLKTRDDEIVRDNRSLHSYRIRHSIDTYITAKDYTLSNSNNNVQNEKDNVNVMDAKFGASVISFPSTSKSGLPRNIKDR